jgi:membrane-bound metal-dependent hydrolase YbcI (DUF457 family)
MDPVTHAVAARMGASIGRPPLSRAAAVLSIVAGLAPDLDAVFMPAGWDLYLRVHETGTHSLLGGVVLAAGLAALTRRVAAESVGALFAIALTGVWIHIFLDVISGATIKPAWPLAHTRTAMGLVAMADPLLAVPAGLALLAVLITRWRVHQLAPLLLLVMGGVLAVKIGSRQLAAAEFRAVADPNAIAHELHADWGSLSGWRAYEKTSSRVRLWDVSAWDGGAQLILDQDLAGPSDMVQGETALSPVVNFLRAHDFPVRVSTRGGATTTVFWSDLRFCFRPDARSGPAVGGHVRPTPEALACGVWFGGEIGLDGRVLRQFVTIGDYLQER